MTLRVLHCIYDDPDNPWVGGGGAVRVREIYRRLVDRVSATVVTGRFPGARDETRDGVAYRRLGAAAPYAWSRATYARAAERLLREASYDAAVLDFSAYAPVRVPARRPVGVTVHHLTGPTARARWGRVAGAVVERVERGLLRRGRRFSVDVPAMVGPVGALAPRDATVEVVPAGVPDALFELPRGADAYLLYFGRLDVFQKGLDTLLDAVARLAARRPDVRLRLAGRGRDGARVLAMARALGIADRVELLGPVSDEVRRTLLAGASVLLMPSRFEGFGMTAAEGMAAGVPLVATAVGALPDVVAPPDGGVLVPPDDPEALATAVARLLDDPAARLALGRSARRVAERFRWHAVAERHLEFLEHVTALRSVQDGH